MVPRLGDLMRFDKTQKRALVFVAGLLGLSWYMGNQFERADMMRSEGKLPCCSKPSMFFTMRGLRCRNCSKEDRIYRPAKEDSFNQMRSEEFGAMMMPKRYLMICPECDETVPEMDSCISCNADLTAIEIPEVEVVDLESESYTPLQTDTLICGACDNPMERHHNAKWLENDYVCRTCNHGYRFDGTWDSNWIDVPLEERVAWFEAEY